MKIEVVRNKDPKAGALDEYLRVTLEKETLLFTKNEIEVARDRARKNPEDCFELEDAIQSDFLRTLVGG